MRKSITIRSTFVSGFRVLVVVDYTGCQVSIISMCFILYFEQAGTAMAFLSNSKPSKEGKDWRRAR